jgi:hypothetical protein
MVSFGSITGLASQALGSVSNFRTLLDAAPSLTTLAFPPQVTLALKAANALGLGLPSTPQQALTRVLGSTDKIDNILGGLKNTTTQVQGILGQVTIKVDGVTKSISSVEETLNSIDWLR